MRAGRPRGGEGADTELPLSLTLEEMAAGGPKQLSYSRNIADGVSGELLTVEELATVQLAPGVREGTRCAVHVCLLARALDHAALQALSLLYLQSPGPCGGGHHGMRQAWLA
jgi:hypothetical protein